MPGTASGFDPGGLLRRPVQAWIDRRCRESTALRDALAAVAGRHFAIELEGPDLNVLLAATAERLEWLPAGSATPDATLSTRPFDAIALARSQSLTDLKKTDARLNGNIRIAEQFARVLELLTPEPEAELAGWVGDIAAHEIATTGRRVVALIRRTVAALEADSAEFLKEEQPALARPWEVDAFIESVDELRDAVARAEQRLAALERGNTHRARR